MKTKKLVLIVLFFFLVFPGLLFSANYDIKQMTPEIQQALQNRQSRYDALQSLKSQGAIGENNRGLVQALQASANSLVETENQDRQVIYAAIVQQNNLGQAGMTQVQTVFGEVQREKARPGDMIQLPSGEWVKK